MQNHVKFSLQCSLTFETLEAQMMSYNGKIPIEIKTLKKYGCSGVLLRIVAFK